MNKAPGQLAFCCDKCNDLYRCLRDAGEFSLKRVDTPEAAVEAAGRGDGVLILGDEYPAPCDSIDAGLLAAARKKGLRLFIEYPAKLPQGVARASCPCVAEAARPCSSKGKHGRDARETHGQDAHATTWERVVVMSGFFGKPLPQGSILALHGCWYVPFAAPRPHLVAARVAGYRDVAFGLPPDVQPILFEHGRDVMVAASKLSQFVTGRYAPTVAWRTLWQRLIAWLCRMPASAAGSIALDWSPAVTVQHSTAEPLPRKAEQDAWRRNVEWFGRTMLFHPAGGVFEGFEAAIDHLGRQPIRNILRGDCTGEAAMVFAPDFAARRDPASRDAASRILDNVWSAPAFRHADPARPAYGLNNWTTSDGVFYGDDNARVIMPAMLAGRLLCDERWDEHALRCLLANLRTTGRLGFRHSRIELGDFQPGPDGWRHFRDQDVTHFAPHYQGYLWAAFLWAYALTGHESFLKPTLTAIRMTMDKYPRWEWTNGQTQEIARMMLPLAFLVRIDPAAEHRQWLDRLAADLLAQMQPCGAIREQLGADGDGRYPPPKSNDEYGKYEAPLIQRNGDPSCDLLYTTNYAFLALHEAAAATGDAKLRTAADRLAAFLCRVQVRSKAHPELDGAWMRGFDYELWEYYGSSADVGWGAWCIESGWTNAWIASVLAMRELGLTLFDLSLTDRFRRLMPRLLAEMSLA